MYGRGMKNHNFSDVKLSDSMEEKDTIFWNVTLYGGYVVADWDTTSMTARGGRPMVVYIQQTFRLNPFAFLPFALPRDDQTTFADF